MKARGHACLDGEFNELDPGWEEYDAQGVYLARVCKKCKAHRLGVYRPEILTGYTQADVDEPIEPEEDVG